MSLDIPINLEIIGSSARELPTYTPKINFDTGKITGYCDGVLAMEQAVKLILDTPRFKKIIYDTEYGSEIESIITDNTDVLQIETIRIITEALLADERIIRVYNFNFSGLKDVETVHFSIKTIFGELHEEVTINV